MWLERSLRRFGVASLPVNPTVRPRPTLIPVRTPARWHVVVGDYREERGSVTPDTNGVPAHTASSEQTEAAASRQSHEEAAAPALAPAAVRTASPPPQPPGFTARRLLVFSGLVLGYAAYYLTRNSLTYTAPVMVADPTLNFSLAQVGTMTSIFPIAYGMSKFVSGIVGDRYSPTLLLGGGLLLTAACNLALGAGSSLPWFAAMWALNGLMQGVGAPSCARMLTSWFATHERGTYWGLWNVAHNTGGFLSPLVAATAAHTLGWRWGMWAPGLAGLVLAMYVLLACKDTPRDAGYSPVEPAQPPTNKRPAQGAHQDGAADAAGDGSKPGVLRAAIDNVLSNPYIWALALTYFCVYVVRQGVTSWTIFYLINEKGVADAAQAAVRVSGLELGGLVGGLAAGRLSDLLIRGSSSSKGAAAGTGSVGKRVQVVMAYTAALAAALAAFQALPAGCPPVLQWLSVAAIGFCIYGPQMLIGLCGAELVHPASVGASQGVLGWVAYLGAANAGVPLSFIITRFGWTAYFTALSAACGVALLLMVPMMRLSSYAQREQQQAAAAAGAGAGVTDSDGNGSGAMRPKMA